MNRKQDCRMIRVIMVLLLVKSTIPTGLDYDVTSDDSNNDQSVDGGLQGNDWIPNTDQNFLLNAMIDDRDNFLPKHVNCKCCRNTNDIYRLEKKLLNKFPRRNLEIVRQPRSFENNEFRSDLGKRKLQRFEPEDDEYIQEKIKSENMFHYAGNDKEFRQQRSSDNGEFRSDLGKRGEMAPLEFDDIQAYPVNFRSKLENFAASRLAKKRSGKDVNGLEFRADLGKRTRGF